MDAMLGSGVNILFVVQAAVSGKAPRQLGARYPWTL